MASKLIKLEDGTLVEIEVPGDRIQQISSKGAEEVASSLNKIKPILVSISRPLQEVWKELNQEMEVEQAEVELGFSFEGEGNLYVTKAKAGSNLTVKLTLKPKSE
ncbi:MAG: CU044_2847 family protein [Spirulina sp.]